MERLVGCPSNGVAAMNANSLVPKRRHSPRGRLLGLAIVCVLTIGVVSLRGHGYVSPYAITLDGNIGEWTSDFAVRDQAILSNSSPAPADWYTHDYGLQSYGPKSPQLFSSSSAANPLAVVEMQFDRGGPVFNSSIHARPVDVSANVWSRQRLLHAASQLIGTHYQHLHIPTFDPTRVTGSTFDWSPVSGNEYLQTTQDLRSDNPGTVLNPYKAHYNSPHAGIDCTDFSAYLYNLALGIQMHSGTANQVLTNSWGDPTALVLDSSGATMTPVFYQGPNYGTGTVNASGSLDSVISQLQPGDLLYMHGRGVIAHVVVWLGEYGTLADGSPSPVPLVISSHDNTPAIFDTTEIDAITGLPLDGLIDEHLPPPGVHILPFTPDTWFYGNFSLAMHVVPEPSTEILFLLGAFLAAGAAMHHRIRVEKD